MAEIIAVVLFIILGLLSLTASIFNLKWLFTSESGRFFIKLFGKAGARIFYGAIGILVLYMAYEVLRSNGYIG
ncbi:MAG: immunity 17 family protein [Bacteroidetes bacterium]|uniref:Immunity 17 family protein n=1 Tax=Candidatus Caccoplasma merdipullorum TaxID=2840718 RepID=A0A9D9E456_9BACT|nr:immunity 17 family protein [Candidatus Caccoplasma merdipullorum]